MTITPEHGVLLKKRSTRVAMNPGELHVGMAEPTRSLDHASVFATFLLDITSLYTAMNEVRNTSEKFVPVGGVALSLAFAIIENR